MGCISPNYATQEKPGQQPRIQKLEAIVHNGLVDSWGEKPFQLKLPCGRCIGCMLDRRRSWAIRSVHEATLHEKNCFLTLTYDNEHLPSSGGLRKKDWQDFMKRWRQQRERDARARGARRAERVSYLMCGEYGSATRRPHYHALIFGEDFLDTAYDFQERAGHGTYSSAQIDHHWGKGFHWIGSVSFNSASYVASYTTKKLVTRDQESERVDMHTGEVLERQFAQASLKPAIAKEWLPKYAMKSVYQDDQVVMKDGLTLKAPRFYDDWLKQNEPEAWSEIQRRRQDYVCTNKERFSDRTLSRKERLYEYRMKRSLENETL